MTYKRLLLFLFLLLVLLPGRAQFVGPLAARPEFKRSWGLTFGSGAYHTMAYSPNANLVTGMFVLDVKRQFTPTLALGLEGNLLLPNQNLLQSHSARSMVYLYGGINLVNLFVTPPVEPRRVELDGILSLGWGHNFKEEAANRDLGASYLVSKLGLNLSWYLNAERSWALNLRPALFYDLRTEKENSQIEYNIHKASMMLSVGFTYRWTGEKRARRRTFIHGLEEEDDEEDVVVNDTVRTMYIFPRLASRGRRSRSRTLPTPSMALNPVQRADLQPTTRVVSGTELPGNYHMDSTGHVVVGDREYVVPLPKKMAPKPKPVETVRPSEPVTYGENHETGAPLEPGNESVMIIPLSQPERKVTPARPEKVTPPVKSSVADTTALNSRGVTPVRGAVTSAPVKHAVPQTPDRASERREHDRPVVQTPHRSATQTMVVATPPVKVRGEEYRLVTTGPDRPVEKADYERKVRQETTTRGNDQPARVETRREQTATQTTTAAPVRNEAATTAIVPVAPARIVIETPDPVAPVPELQYGTQPLSPVTTALPVQQEPEVQPADVVEDAPRRTAAKKARSEEFDVYFAAGSAAVTGAPLGEVARLVNYLRRNPSATVTLAGYVSGGENRALARRRVDVVRGLLVSRYGIEARRIHATAYGIAYFSPLPAKNRVVVAHAGE